MGRFKCQVKSKQLRRPLHSKDTPIKTKLIKHKNNFRRVLSEKINIYGPLLEESEFEETDVPTAQGSLNNVEPVQFDGLSWKGFYCSQLNVKNLSHSSTTLANNNDRDASPPMPTPSNPMTPAPLNTFGNFGYFESPGDDPIVLTAALETGAASSGLENDTSISYEVSDGSSTPVTSTTCTSSLPSPEVFRSVCDKVTPSVWALRPLDFSIEEELLHPKVKNSTLLDVSNAKNVHMHQPLDLSTIKGTKIESKRGCDHFVSDWNFKRISPKSRLSEGATSVQCKKKVHFHRPVCDVILRQTDATMANQDARGAVQTRIKESMGKVKAKIFTEESKPHFFLNSLKRPRRPGQDTTYLFNFTCVEHRDVFFQRLRDRYARLRSVPPFLQTKQQWRPKPRRPILKSLFTNVQNIVMPNCKKMI